MHVLWQVHQKTKHQKCLHFPSQLHGFHHQAHANQTQGQFLICQKRQSLSKSRNDWFRHLQCYQEMTIVSLVESPQKLPKHQLLICLLLSASIQQKMRGASTYNSDTSMASDQDEWDVFLGHHSPTHICHDGRVCFCSIVVTGNKTSFAILVQ